MKYRACILEDPRLLRKFCQSMDRNYGCFRAFGTSSDSLGECKSCPLATAEKVMWLMQFKGMTMGEAVKATLRGPYGYAEAKETLAAHAREKEPYPYLKENEERAAAAVILGEARDEEDD